MITEPVNNVRVSIIADPHLLGTAEIIILTGLLAQVIGTLLGVWLAGVLP